MRPAPLVTLVLLAACGNAAAPADPESPGTTPNAAVVTVGGCQVFPGDNAWNRDVSADPVDPASDALLAQMSPDDPLHLDLGTTEEYYGIPFSVVPASQPLVPISYGTDGADYSDESDPGPMPIPLDVPIEGGSSSDPNPSSGDRHVLVVQQGSCMLYELLIFADQGSAWYVTGTSDPRWQSALDQLRAHKVYGRDFEVVRIGPVTSC